MRYFIGLSAYALTGVASFMIPPNTDGGADGTLKITIPDGPAPLQTFGVDPYSQIVQLPCPGCPYAQYGQQGVSWTKEQENYLVLNVSVGATSKSLDLDGVQIYPPAIALTGEPEVLQVPADMTLEEVRSTSTMRKVIPAHSLRLTAWTLKATSVHSDANSQEEIIDMHLRVHALEQRPVQIPEVIITAVKDRNGDLLIINARASKVPYNVAEECNTWPLLCRWKAIVSSRLNAMRHKFKSACHKRPGFGMMHKKPHHGRPHHRPHGASGKRPHHRPHHVRPHHRPQSGEQSYHHKSHHHHHDHPVMDKIAQICLTIIIPLLIGILAGMVTYLVGMLFGMAIAYVWAKIRSRRASYAPIALGDDAEEGRASYEKDELIEEVYEDAPPIYIKDEQN